MLLNNKMHKKMNPVFKILFALIILALNGNLSS